MKHLVFLCAVSFFLSSCSVFLSDTEPYDSRRVGLGDKADWRLLSPEDYGAAVSLTQTISLSSKKQLVLLLVYLEIEPEQGKLLALSQTMNPVFSLQDDGEKISLDSHAFMPLGVSPAEMLRDMQFIYWPVDKLNASLQEKSSSLNLSLVEVSYPESKERKLTNKQGDILFYISYEFDKENIKTIIFKNKVRGYRYRIDLMDE